MSESAPTTANALPSDMSLSTAASLSSSLRGSCALIGLRPLVRRDPPTLRLTLSGSWMWSRSPSSPRSRRRVVDDDMRCREIIGGVAFGVESSGLTALDTSVTEWRDDRRGGRGGRWWKRSSAGSCRSIDDAVLDWRCGSSCSADELLDERETRIGMSPFRTGSCGPETGLDELVGCSLERSSMSYVSLPTSLPFSSSLSSSSSSSSSSPNSSCAFAAAAAAGGRFVAALVWTFFSDLGFLRPSSCDPAS